MGVYWAQAFLMRGRYSCLLLCLRAGEAPGDLLIEYVTELRSALHQSQDLCPRALIMASATPTALGQGSHTAALADRALAVNHTISLYLFYICHSYNITVFSQFYTQNNLSYEMHIIGIGG